MKKSYLNDKITNNNWNTAWFWQANVASSPAPGKRDRKRRDIPRKWGDVLERYLREIGAVPGGKLEDDEGVVEEIEA